MRFTLFLFVLAIVFFAANYAFRLDEYFEPWLEKLDLRRLDVRLTKGMVLVVFSAGTLFVLAVIAAICLHGIPMEDQ